MLKQKGSHDANIFASLNSLNIFGGATRSRTGLIGFASARMAMDSMTYQHATNCHINSRSCLAQAAAQQDTQNVLWFAALTTGARSRCRDFFLGPVGVSDGHCAWRDLGRLRSDASSQSLRSTPSISDSSAINSKGAFWFATYKGGLTGEIFVELLKKLMHRRKQAVHMVLDRLPAHQKALVKPQLQAVVRIPALIQSFLDHPSVAHISDC